MMVTEGGGAGSFGAAGGFGMAGGAVFCCRDGCGALGSACGDPASFCAQEVATADVAKATAIQMNWRLARIPPPELHRDHNSRPIGPTSCVRADQCAITIETWIWPRVRKTSSDTSSPLRRTTI